MGYIVFFAILVDVLIYSILISIPNTCVFIKVFIYIYIVLPNGNTYQKIIVINYNSLVFKCFNNNTFYGIGRVYWYVT